MKSKNMASKVDSLLRSLDKRKLEEFIRAECENNVQVCNRFLALGADRRLVSNPGRYSSLIEGLIEDYSRHGYITVRLRNDAFSAEIRLARRGRGQA